MTRKLCLPLALILLGLFLPAYGVAQSDSGEPSLGDLARLFRRGKTAPEHTVIDNDNLHQIMDEVQNRKLDGSLLFSIDGATKKFQVSSPDVTCDLSFSAAATSLLSNAYAPQDLPEGELAKLDGPATIAGDTLEVSVHNGTSWNIREITVGLTILRSPEPGTAHQGSARLVPAAETTSLWRKSLPIQPFSTTSKARPRRPARRSSARLWARPRLRARNGIGRLCRRREFLRQSHRHRSRSRHRSRPNRRRLKDRRGHVMPA